MKRSLFAFTLIALIISATHNSGIRTATLQAENNALPPSAASRPVD